MITYPEIGRSYLSLQCFFVLIYKGRIYYNLNFQIYQIFYGHFSKKFENFPILPARKGRENQIVSLSCSVSR